MALTDTFLSGLLLYLQIRTWAVEKMRSFPRGSAGIDLEIYQYLYLSNALAALDLVGEMFYGCNFRRPAYHTYFEQSVIRAFELALRLRPASDIGSTASEAYGYVRELRNSVVHRGVGSVSAGHIAGEVVVALCPRP